MRSLLALSLFCSLSFLHQLNYSYGNDYPYWPDNNVDPSAEELTPSPEYRYFNRDYDNYYRNGRQVDNEVDDFVVS